MMINPLARRTTPEVEEVVLLDEHGQGIGCAPKSTIHTMDTPLHSAFSIFLFNHSGQMLVQQRAWSKKTWPGIWSNACCGHPLPGESHESAAARRLIDELDLHDIPLELALPHYRYRAEYRSIVENEICPVFIGRCDTTPRPNTNEVEAIDWVNWETFIANTSSKEDSRYAKFSPWSRSEAQQLHQSGLVDALLASNAVSATDKTHF